MAGWEMDSDAGRRRMAADEAFLASPHRWPGSGQLCAVKAQPWADGCPRFGMVMVGDPLAVVLDGGGVVHYPSLQELVRFWSVD